MVDSLRPQYVNTDDSVGMPELERTNYNIRNYNHLKTIIRKDGFKKQYAIRAIFNKRLKKYEVFDGNHRLKVAKELEIKQIPLIDETAYLTRSQAIAEGIKANTSHAYYNALDLAKNAKQLILSISSETEHKSVGRPPTGIADVAEILGISERQMRNYLNLLELPEDVQTLVGQGKITMTGALVLLKLRGTPYFGKVSEIALDAVSKGTSRKELEKIVASVLKKGYRGEDVRMCVGCHNVYSRDRVSFPCLCPECVAKLRSGNHTGLNQDRKKALQTYLKLRNWVEKRHKEGREIPEYAFTRLDELHAMWKAN